MNGVRYGKLIDVYNVKSLWNFQIKILHLIGFILKPHSWCFSSLVAHQVHVVWPLQVPSAINQRPEVHPSFKTVQALSKLQTPTSSVSSRAQTNMAPGKFYAPTSQN